MFSRPRRLTRYYRWSDATVKHDVRRLTRYYRWSDATIKSGVRVLAP